MTDLVKSLKIGNNSYNIQDGNTLPALTASQRTTLLSNGTYLGNPVESGKIFETDSGKFESFTDTVSPPTITTAAVSMASYPRIAYGSGMFIQALANDSSSVYYSTTGESGTWASRSLPTGLSFIRYHNDRFIAYSTGYLSAGVQMCYSTNGVNWETFTSPWNKYGAISSTYGNGKYVLLGNSFSSSNTSYSKVAYSTDGCATWTSVSLPASTTWISVTYGNGVFVAISNDSATAAYSEDGVTWNSFQMPSSGWYRILFSNGVFVAFRTYTNVVAYSSDGVNWTETTLPASANWEEIAYGDGTFVIIARLDSIFAYSTDGIHWSQGTMPQNTSWYGVAYGAGKFIASNNYNNNGAKITFEITHTYSLTPLSYTKSEVDTALASKQGTLTAGTGISISSDTVAATAMTGSDGTNAGTLGAVPAPAATDNTKFLRGDGTWAEAGGGGSVSYKGVNTQSITGTTDPTSSTEASIGTLYVNTTTSTPFICVNNTMTPNFSLHTESSGYATVTDGILTASSGYTEIVIPQVSSGSTVSYVTKVKFKRGVSTLTTGRNLLNLRDTSWANSFGLYLLSSGVFAISTQVNGTWSQHNSTVTPLIGSYVWLSFSMDSNGYVTSSISLDGESWQQLCSPFTFSSFSGYTRFDVGDLGPVESGWETDTDLNKTHLYINGVEEKLYNISNVSWSELHDSSVVQTLPVSPKVGKIYFVTGSIT